jgi:arsenate reductase (thioredoxin)
MARVLFVCHQNAGRSQMSQELFTRVASGHHQARSAGTYPAQRVHPVVAEAMSELGMDIADRKPQKLTGELSQWADLVVTMGCGDECPYIPGKEYIDWDLTDPAGKSLAEVRVIRDDIDRRVKELAKQLDSRAAKVS